MASKTTSKKSTAKTEDSAPNIGKVAQVPLNKALGDRYLAYALSTITARSLPDVRDGLKPVHRRILYAMKSSGNVFSKPYRKSANAVGYVMMHYHPHGDQAIYDSLVRMAQDFSMRYPLVDGQGNFGSIDGDNAAAFRYTEARLQQISEEMVDGINENAVDFQDTYNGQKKEPKVLPAAFPNLLANGASGIAVGMATNIPPHNLGEICDALRHVIKHPNAPISTLLGKMPGPDFPTGGVIVEPHDNILKAYETGKGAVRLRAAYEVEELKGGTYQVIVTEIPYQVQKSRLIERIADLLIAKKLPLLADIQDESAADVRIVLTPKNRSIDPKALMESLFRSCELEVRFNLNMNVLNSDGVPGVMNLREVLQAYLDHRHDILKRRSQHQLQKIDDRLEILSGLQVAFLNLDEVIRIIRHEDEPKPVLMSTFKLTENQAEAILNTKLRNLRKLDEMEIQNEMKDLEAKKKALLELLDKEDLRWQHIDEEIKALKKKFADPRRTQFAEAPKINVDEIEAVVEREPVTVICSKKYWARSMKNHLKDFSEIKYKDGDAEMFVQHAYTTDKIIFVASNGRTYSTTVDKLPSGRGHGEPLNLSFDIDPGIEIVRCIVFDAKKPEDKDQLYLLASTDGRGFLTSPEHFLASTKNGKQVMTPGKGEKLKTCVPADGDTIAVIGTNRKLLLFDVAEMVTLNKGRGVMLQKYRDAKLSDVKFFNKADGLTWPMGGTSDRTRTVTDILMWMGRRASVGKLPPAGFPRDNTFGE